MNTKKLKFSSIKDLVLNILIWAAKTINSLTRPLPCTFNPAKNGGQWEICVRVVGGIGGMIFSAPPV